MSEVIIRPVVELSARTYCHILWCRNFVVRWYRVHLRHNSTPHEWHKLTTPCTSQKPHILSRTTSSEIREVTSAILCDYCVFFNINFESWIFQNECVKYYRAIGVAIGGLRLFCLNTIPGATHSFEQCELIITPVSASRSLCRNHEKKTRNCHKVYKLHVRTCTKFQDSQPPPLFDPYTHSAHVLQYRAPRVRTYTYLMDRP